MKYEISFDGRRNLEIAEKVLGMSCYKMIATDSGEFLGQLEIVLDNGQQGYAFSARKEGLAVLSSIDGKKVEDAIDYLASIGIQDLALLTLDAEYVTECDMDEDEIASFDVSFYINEDYTWENADTGAATIVRKLLGNDGYRILIRHGYGSRNGMLKAVLDTSNRNFALKMAKKLQEQLEMRGGKEYLHLYDLPIGAKFIWERKTYRVVDIVTDYRINEWGDEELFYTTRATSKDEKWIHDFGGEVLVKHVMSLPINLHLTREDAEYIRILFRLDRYEDAMHHFHMFKSTRFPFDTPDEDILDMAFMFDI